MRGCSVCLRSGREIRASLPRRLVMLVVRPHALTAIGHLVPALVVVGVASAGSGRAASAPALRHGTALRRRRTGVGRTCRRITGRGSRAAWRSALCICEGAVQRRAAASAIGVSLMAVPSDDDHSAERESKAEGKAGFRRSSRSIEPASSAAFAKSQPASNRFPSRALQSGAV